MPEYCSRCILPDTRPGVKLDRDRVCGGCRNAERKRSIDWQDRRQSFTAVVSEAQGRGGPYDCVIPVSGGKDSFWQVVTCLEHGLHPLCVTYVCPGRNELGRRNLDQLRQLGVDLLEFRMNPHAERRFVDKSFRRTGISGLVTHMAIYRWPVQVALAQGIPLVVYGENSAFEYGSEDEALAGARVDQDWLQSFGVTAGTTAGDWVDEDLTTADVTALLPPTPAQLAEADLRVLFLGHYFAWDPENSRRVAAAHGFVSRAEGPRVGHYDFVNIDDDMIGVHHHPKWHKFGITRTWDTLSMEIRAGRMSREEAIAAVGEGGPETPLDDIRVFCEYLGLSREEYFQILEGFRNPEIWARRDGRWVIPGFLVPDLDWPVDGIPSW